MSKPARQKRIDFKRLMQYLERLREKRFTGKVTLNFFDGGVSNLNIGSEPVIWENESVRLK